MSYIGCVINQLWLSFCYFWRLHFNNILELYLTLFKHPTNKQSKQKQHLLSAFLLLFHGILISVRLIWRCLDFCRFQILQIFKCFLRWSVDEFRMVNIFEHQLIVHTAYIYPRLWLKRILTYFTQSMDYYFNIQMRWTMCVKCKLVYICKICIIS